MIHMSGTLTSKQAKSYFLREGRTQKGTEIGYFHGDGLKHLGIKENQEVSPELYHKLLDGFNPATGEKLAKNAGFDVTFSSPKSVSLLESTLKKTGGTEQANELRNLHEKAVKNAMEKIAQNYSKTRKWIDGERVKVKADMVFASFQHDTTRIVNGEIDPQFHTHNFIFSTCFYTEPKTGVVKSLALSSGEIYMNRMHLEKSYQSVMERIYNG